MSLLLKLVQALPREEGAQQKLFSRKYCTQLWVENFVRRGVCQGKGGKHFQFHWFNLKPDLSYKCSQSLAKLAFKIICNCFLCHPLEEWWQLSTLYLQQTRQPSNGQKLSQENSRFPGRNDWEVEERVLFHKHSCSSSAAAVHSKGEGLHYLGYDEHCWEKRAWDVSYFLNSLFPSLSQTLRTCTKWHLDGKT